MSDIVLMLLVTDRAMLVHSQNSSLVASIGWGPMVSHHRTILEVAWKCLDAKPELVIPYHDVPWDDLEFTPVDFAAILSFGTVEVPLRSPIKPNQLTQAQQSVSLDLDLNLLRSKFEQVARKVGVDVSTLLPCNLDEYMSMYAKALKDFNQVPR